MEIFVERKPIAAVFTDMHMGVHDDGDYWLNECLSFTDWYLADTAKRGIKRTIFAGDLFEKRNEICVKTLDTAKVMADRFVVENHVVLAIPGNHDCYFKDHSKVNSIKLMSQWTVFNDTTVVEIDGLKIGFIPWGDKMPDSPVDVIVGHFDIMGFKMQKNRLSEHGLASSDITRFAKLTLTGHYHLRQEQIFSDGTRILFVGNPFQTNYGDSGEQKGYYILYDNLETEFVEYTAGPKHIYFNTSQGIDTAKEIGEACSNLHIVITIDTDMEDEVAELEAFLRILKPKSYRVEDARQSDSESENTLATASAFTAQELFSEYMETLTDKDADTKKETIDYINSKL